MTKKVTINEVAKKSGYGLGTVSRVVSGDKSVKESTRKRIQEVIEELHYVPNVNGKRLRKKHSGVIAVMVPVINHPFFAELVEDVEQVADKAGCSLLLVTSQMNKEKEKEILLKIRQKEIDGAIFVTHYEHDPSEFDGCPLVSIDRHISDDVPFVSSDNYDATKSALERLYQSGARKIGFLGTKPTVESEVSLRKKAYDDFINEKGMEPCAMFEIINHGEEEHLVDLFLEKAKDLDAVFVSNNVLSQIFYVKALASGKRFPEDLQLISYDGVFSAWNQTPTITCIQQPIKEMAEASFEILRDLINEADTAKSAILKTKLIVGTTTKQ